MLLWPPPKKTSKTQWNPEFKILALNIKNSFCSEKKVLEICHLKFLTCDILISLACKYMTVSGLHLSLCACMYVCVRERLWEKKNIIISFLSSLVTQELCLFCVNSFGTKEQILILTAKSQTYGSYFVLSHRYILNVQIFACTCIICISRLTYLEIVNIHFSVVMEFT